MNRRSLTFFLGLAFALGFHSCATTYSVVEFEVLEPATVSFPENVGQLIILNRAPISFDVIDEEERQALEPRHLIVLDSSIYLSIFRGLLDVLQQSPIERFQRPYWLNDRRTDTASIEDLFLTKREVDDLCAAYSADAVISLEYYSLDIEEHQQYYTDDEDYLQSLYYQFSDKLIWNIYLPGSPRAFDSYEMHDTLYFTRYLDGEFYTIPSGVEMIRELFTSSGRKYGSYLVPVWNSASRLLYKGKGEPLKLASRYTDQGEWDEAYEIWEGVVSSGSDSTLVSKALHNMAIYHELEDDLDSASLFVSKALSYDSLEYTVLYKEELETRLLNRREVLKQVR